MPAPSRAVRERPSQKAKPSLLVDTIRILIVADPLLRQVLRELLSGRGFDIVGEVGTTEEGIRTAQQMAPDVIIFEPELVHAEFGSVLRKLKTVRPHAGLLVISQHDDHRLVRQALESGATGYVLRGFSRRKLIALVRVVREGVTVMDAALLQGVLDNSADAGAQPRSAAVGATNLTRVEREVLHLIAQGLTNKEISTRKRWSLGTTKKYIQNILEKLDASDRTQAAVQGFRFGLLHEEGLPGPS